jgi:hypothetical protein
MREKGRFKKVKKILIRVNPEERDYAFSAAKKEGKNTSELFRELLKNHEEDKIHKLILRIGKRNEKLFKEYRSMLGVLLKIKRKGKG